ncbi:MAG TPA: cupin domain-containing protein [Stellaceae bacterium]|nr:cupin domain-containing protein [Stellaceae bacterium]
MDDRATMKPEMALALALKDQARFVPGRRAFFKYRELGVTEATKGRMRAQVTSAEKGLSEPTGWHYHTCDMQFVYMLKGWVDLEFEDGTKVKLQPGDSVMIPGGLKHQEVATSETMELLEVSLPAEMGTVPCAAPASASAAR